MNGCVKIGFDKILVNKDFAAYQKCNKNEVEINIFVFKHSESIK